ncbi:hypothetical protein [Suttonella ornithocola]|uniref:HTH cro/C1-type domain-containing protein n=1 Tax=Suttonella ornithocola TaxID=279832 RepID=A0A380MRX2_9GAMM|nr:hypothetical protein [Suttonella ornithocola]SUO95038.1 Uncharacterised protein [Suttonella ornithocola]
MRPENVEINLDFNHLRNLIDDIGLSQTEIAHKLGISKRDFRSYLFAQDAKTYKPMPYVVYYALYVWATYERFKKKSI